MTVNTLMQLFAVARLPPLTSTSSRLMLLTHMVAKTFAGIGVLDFIDNGGVVMVSPIPSIRVSINLTSPQGYRAPPSALVAGLTYALFPLATAVSTPFFGSILLYDVLGIMVGQRGVLGAGRWTTGLGCTAVAMGGIIGAKIFLTERKI